MFPGLDVLGCGPQTRKPIVTCLLAVAFRIPVPLARAAPFDRATQVPFDSILTIQHLADPRPARLQVCVHFERNFAYGRAFGWNKASEVPGD